jgi:nitroreductase
MVRAFLDLPVDPDTVERILAAGQRGPSAGYSQGYAFLVLQGRKETKGFWEAAARGEDGWPGEQLRRAPVLVVPCAGRHVYLDRYAEPDKGWVDRDPGRWPVPFWTVDTAFAAMLMLLACVDEGLGALFFGLDKEGFTAVRGAFGIPPEWDPIGAIALGHSAPLDPVRSSAHSRPRRPQQDLVHRGRWQGTTVG